MPISDYIEKERAEVAALFEEDVELSPHDFRPTFTEFRVMAVDGREAKHRVLVSFYDTQAYMDPHNRMPWKQLKVSDLDVRVRYGQVGNYANKVLRVLDPGHDLAEIVQGDPRAESQPARPEAGLLVERGAKLSLRAMLEEAYRLGGYGEYPDRKNFNGVTVEEARELADQAIGSGERLVASEAREGERAIWSFREGKGVDSPLDIDDLLSEIDMAQGQDPFDDGFLHRCTRVYEDGHREGAGFRVSEQPYQLLTRLGREGQALFEVSERDGDLIWRFGTQISVGDYGYEVETRVLPHGVLALMESLGYDTADARAAISGERFEERHAALGAIWEQSQPIGTKIADIVVREPNTHNPADIAAAARGTAADLGQVGRGQMRGKAI